MRKQQRISVFWVVIVIGILLFIGYLLSYDYWYNHPGDRETPFPEWFVDHLNWDTVKRFID